MGLTFEMKGMCILVYGLMSLISTWVLMFLRSSATQSTSSDTKQREALPSRSSCMWTEVTFTLTLYVLSNERVVHYVTVICFQDFFKFSDVIVLVGAGRKTHSVVFIVDIVSLRASQQLSTRKLSNAKQHIHVYENTILTAVLGVFLVSCWYGMNY